MSLVTALLNQTATLRRIATGPDSWGNCTYSTSSISVRFEKRTKLFRRSETESWTATSHIYTDTELQEGDEVTIGSVTVEVQEIKHSPDLAGSATFYEGWA